MPSIERQTGRGRKRQICQIARLGFACPWSLYCPIYLFDDMFVHRWRKRYIERDMVLLVYDLFFSGPSIVSNIPNCPYVCPHESRDIPKRERQTEMDSEKQRY